MSILENVLRKIAADTGLGAIAKLPGVNPDNKIATRLVRFFSNPGNKDVRYTSTANKAFTLPPADQNDVDIMRTKRLNKVDPVDLSRLPDWAEQDQYGRYWGPENKVYPSDATTNRKIPYENVPRMSTHPKHTASNRCPTCGQPV